MFHSAFKVTLSWTRVHGVIEPSILKPRGSFFSVDLLSMEWYTFKIDVHYFLPLKPLSLGAREG